MKLLYGVQSQLSEKLILLVFIIFFSSRDTFTCVIQRRSEFYSEFIFLDGAKPANGQHSRSDWNGFLLRIFCISWWFTKQNNGG
jgi:hypothetical protein